MDVLMRCTAYRRRSRKFSGENKAGTTIISKYGYLVNAIGQRTEVNTSGTALPATPSWAWGYDSLGQVISANSSVNTNDRAYQYDAIGNRKKSADSLTLPTSDNYTSNALNQYSSLSLNSQPPTLNQYDFDGNLRSGQLPTGSAGIVWDAENRIIAVNVIGQDTIHYTYDAQSRRISRSVGVSPTAPTTIYVYDAWNVIAEYSATSLSKTYLWGTDLSGSLQGAGGVGGLLSLQIHDPQSTIYYPTYDGNGNVSEYVASNGSTAAHFEYDPFGNTVVNTDTSNQFAYRFSTKPLDRTTGLYYYGYRYYDPVTGRWPSRDPIEEEVGINLYGFVDNTSTNNYDYLGKYGAIVCRIVGAETLVGMGASAVALLFGLKSVEECKKHPDCSLALEIATSPEPLACAISVTTVIICSAIEEEKELPKKCWVTSVNNSEHGGLGCAVTCDNGFTARFPCYQGAKLGDLIDPGKFIWDLEEETGEIKP
jgi:RHS repeat-associated protein